MIMEKFYPSPSTLLELSQNHLMVKRRERFAEVVRVEELLRILDNGYDDDDDLFGEKVCELWRGRKFIHCGLMSSKFVVWHIPRPHDENETRCRHE